MSIRLEWTEWPRTVVELGRALMAGDHAACWSARRRSRPTAWQERSDVLDHGRARPAADLLVIGQARDGSAGRAGRQHPGTAPGPAHEPLHVAGTAAVEAAVALGPGEGVARPGLPLDRAPRRYGPTGRRRLRRGPRWRSRLALRRPRLEPSGSRHRRSARYSWMKPMQSRLDELETVGNATRRASISRDERFMNRTPSRTAWRPRRDRQASNAWTQRTSHD